MTVLKKVFILYVCCFFLSSCSVFVIKRPAIKAPPSAQNFYREGLKQKGLGKTQLALRYFAKITEEFSDSDLADDASMEVARIYEENQLPVKAYKQYLNIIQSRFESDREQEAFSKALQILIQNGQNDAALKLVKKWIRRSKKSRKSSLVAHKTYLQILSFSQKPLETLKVLVYLASEELTAEKRSQYRNQAIEIIQSNLSLEQMKTISSNSDYSFVRPYVMLQLGQNYIEKRNLRMARYYLIKINDLLPESQLSEEASKLLNQISSLNKVEPYTIGAILPLTGKYSKIAQRTLKGLQLGLGIYDNTPSKFKLAVIDSEGNPDVARKAVERLVQENNVIAIVGSLLSKTSLAVASKAHELGIPNIALSQKSNVTEVGDFIFRNATTSRMQVRRIVKTAMEDMGLKRFAILYPNDNYGIEYSNLFWDEVLSRGGEIRGAVSYTPDETDFRSHVQRLVGTFYVEDRLPEYKLRLKKWADSQIRRTARKNIPSDLLPPIVDFEALFIPDNVTKLGQIVPMLTYNDVEGIKIFGTNLWDTSSLVKRTGKLLYPAFFTSNSLSSGKIKQTDMYKKFSRFFEKPPGVFEIQAYDTALLLRQTISSGAHSRHLLKDELAGMKIFPGVIGELVLSPYREFSQPLSTLTLQNKQIEKFDPSKHLQKEDTKKE